jgi:hypothetical protein
MLPPFSRSDEGALPESISLKGGADIAVPLTSTVWTEPSDPETGGAGCNCLGRVGGRTGVSYLKCLLSCKATDFPGKADGGGHASAWTSIEISLISFRSAARISKRT